MIWVIADTHFNHAKLVVNGIRPFDYQQKIIRNWNSSVQDNDIVIMLGDISWNNDYSILSQLRGRKILVRGNHDKKSCEVYMSKYFDFACDTFSMEYKGIPLIFSHKPLKEFSERYNIHGHLHDNIHRKEETSSRHILVSLENMGYKVFSLNYIFKEASRKEVKK